jgi:hypothetical protein
VWNKWGRLSRGCEKGKDGGLIALLFCQLMAIDATLTPRQKNDVFGLIREYGPPANEFTWDEQDHTWTLYMEGTRTHRVSVLRHQPTGYSCLFGDWVMVVCPGIAKKVETTAHEDSWDKKLDICGKWLVDTGLESRAPDLFKEFLEFTQVHVNEAEGVAEKMGDYINRQIRRLRSASAEDPELAIGTAKEFLETLCKTILDERKIGFARDEDLPGLIKLTIRNLKVVPDGVTAPNIDKTVAALVGNLGSAAYQLAEIRNAFGTGHGKLAGHVGLEDRHAQLVVGAAVTVAVFLFRCHEAG